MPERPHTPPIRVVHLLNQLSSRGGGVAVAVAGLAQAQKRLGIEVFVVGGADRRFGSEDSLWGDLEVHAFEVRNGYGLHAGVPGMIRHLNPDILHVHGIWSATSLHARMAGLGRHKTVVAPHGMLEPWILARRPIVKRIHALLFERPLMGAAHIHALSAAERRAITAFMPELAGRVFVVPNGISAPDLVEPVTGRAGALFLGRLHEKKQPLELIDAWQATQTLSSVTLTVAGWGDADTVDAVRKRADGAANTRFVGPLFGADKRRAFAETRFFILPSVSEGLPMAVLEALQHGAIPVITAQCNLPELIENRIALEMKPDFSNFAEIADRMARMEDAEHKELSARAKAFAERFNWTGITSRMIDAYAGVLDA